MSLGHLMNYKKMFSVIIVLYLFFFFSTTFSASPTPTPVIPGTTAGGGAIITIQDPRGIHTVTIRNLTNKKTDISWAHPGNCPGPTTKTFEVGLATKYQVYYEDCQRHFHIWETSEILEGDPHEKPTFIKEGDIIYETPKPEFHLWSFLKTYGFNVWSILVLLVIIISLIMLYGKRRK